MSIRSNNIRHYRLGKETKAVRHRRAAALLVARARRSDEEQLALIMERRGSSQREFDRLVKRMADPGASTTTAKPKRKSRKAQAATGE